MTHRFTEPPDRRPLALVTGGAGFIGSHLVEHLLSAGWRVRVLDNLSSGRREFMPSNHPEFTFMQGDIRDGATMRAACGGVDVVFHLAALVSVIESIRSPALAEEVNVKGTQIVFESAAAADVRRVVFSSSCAVYGDAPRDPQNEAIPATPVSPYAATKLAGEVIAERYMARGLSAVCLRYFNVYGPRQTPAAAYSAAVPKFIQMALAGQTPTIYGDGGQTRDFVFVHDVARANVCAAHAALPDSHAGVFNVGTGCATSVNELWRLVAELTHTPATTDHGAARAGEIRHSRACTRRAAESLGFTALTSINQGLMRTIGTPSV